MDDLEKIKYWLELSDYDFATAKALLETKRYLYVGFMCHQSLEKLLKAVFIKTNSGIPPYTHSLIDLAKKSLVYEELSEQQKDFIDLIQPLNIQARYPTHKEMIFKTLDYKKCTDILDQTEGLSKWIKMKL